MRKTSFWYWIESLQKFILYDEVLEPISKLTGADKPKEIFKNDFLNIILRRLF